MRYFVTIGRGEDATGLVVHFEDTKEGLIAHIHDGESEEVRTSLPLDYCSLEGGKGLHLIVGDESHDFYLDPIQRGYEVHYRGELLHVEVVDERELLAQSIHGAATSGPREIRASMPGIVVSLEVEPEQSVDDGQTLLILEAMKMQNPILAAGEGRIAAVHVESGQAVAAGELLVTLE